MEAAKQNGNNSKNEKTRAKFQNPRPQHGLKVRAHLLNNKAPTLSLEGSAKYKSGQKPASRLLSPTSGGDHDLRPSSSPPPPPPQACRACQSALACTRTRASSRTLGRKRSLATLAPLNMRLQTDRISCALACAQTNHRRRPTSAAEACWRGKINNRRLGLLLILFASRITRKKGSTPT